MATTVVIVDDHSGFRRMARRMLEDAGFEVVGEAGDGETALSVVALLGPQVVLLDVQLPDVDGFDVAARLMHSEDGPVVVLTSSRDGSDFGPLVERSGARGFIPKGELCGGALSAIIA